MSDAAISDQLRRALLSLRDLRTRYEALEAERHEPVAVVGMACRAPGADDIDALWDLARGGCDAITETPAERWDAAALYDPEPEHPGTVATRWGGFLDDLAGFDAAFFGISPREAAGMDPQQRLLLEVAWEALEHAGQPVEALTGRDVGVFVGIHSQSDDYSTLQASDTRALDLYSGTGTSHSVVAGRLSYLLDLRGPSLAIDTACSSSLVAVHLAVQSLRTGESSMALVGGVNAILEPTFTMVASRMRMMSSTGRCRPFDAAADGFVRAEACGVVVLKRLRDAAADGDRVLAVIRGSAVNQDGRTSGLTAPSSRSQQAVIEAALADARTPPEAVGLIEAHGTGTTLGDPIEVEALAAVFGGVPDRSPCVLGSVKANIGHAEGAAGVIALIKAVQSLRAGEVAPLVHFEALNPHIDLSSTRLVIPTAPAPWPAQDGGRVAGVSSFGWSGTNAHVVVGEAPVPAAPQAPGDLSRPLLLTLSARDDAALVALAHSYRALLVGADPARAVGLCAAAAVHRSHHGRRLAVAGRRAEDLVDQLDAFIVGEPGAASSGRSQTGPALTAFVFPGQGSQWPGMARRLLAEDPVFRASVAASSEAMAPHLGLSLLDLLEGGELGGDVGLVQPALFAVEVGLAASWSDRGVVPDVVVGHSLGEVAAAHVAGILSLDDAVLLICLRSDLLRRIAGRGAMAVLQVDVDGATAALGEYADRVSVAVVNSPTSTVIAGDPAAVDALVAEVAARGGFARRVNVDVASHSPQVDDLLDELVSGLAGIRPGPGAIPFWSTVTDAMMAGPDLDARYWARNLREPVRFAAASRALVDRGHTRLVELSPHPVLVGAVDEALAGTGIAVGSIRRDGDEALALATSLGALYVDGLDPDWTCVHGSAPVLDLPSYPWQRERHWLATSPGGVVGRHGGVPDDALLGFRVAVADPALPLVWEGELVPTDADGEGLVRASTLVELLVRAAASAGGTELVDVGIELRPALTAAAVLPIETVVDHGRGTVVVHVGTDGTWLVAARSRFRSVAGHPILDPGSVAAALRVAEADADAARRPASVVTVTSIATAPTVPGEPTHPRVEGLVLRAAAGLPNRPGEWVHTVRWRIEEAAAPTQPNGERWVAIAEPGGLAHVVAASLGASEGCAVDVIGPHDPRLVTCLAGADRVVFLGALDVGAGWPTGVAELDRAERVGPAALLEVLRALSETGGSIPVHVVTRGAWTVLDHEIPAVGQTLVWGIGRAVAEERPELWGGLIDLDPESGASDLARQLVAELRIGDRSEAAWRGEGRHVAHLVVEPTDPGGIELRPDGTCLVTGAFGAIGRRLLDWLVDHGARRLVLLGRTALPHRREWTSLAPDGPVGRRVALVRHLESRGVATHVAAVDVGDEQALRSFLDEFAAEGWPEIRAVFHAAAVLGGDVLDTLPADGLHRELAPKVTGTWTLADALGDQLDHLVLFSSVAGTLPFPGQGAYAAGNAFVDAAAEALRAMGRPAVSVAWPYWEGTDGVLDGEAGQVGDDGRGLKEIAREMTESVGMSGITMSEGLGLLGALADHGPPRPVVVPVDWARFGAARGPRVPALVRDLVTAARHDEDRTSQSVGLVGAVAGADPAARLEMVGHELRRLVAEIVRLSPSRIDDDQPFGALGFDSLLALELRNRLESTIGLPFPATVVWNHPTISELSLYVVDRIGGGTGPAARPPGGAGPDHPSTADHVATDDLAVVSRSVRELTEEEALAALIEGAGS